MLIPNRKINMNIKILNESLVSDRNLPYVLIYIGFFFWRAPSEIIKLYNMWADIQPYSRSCQI